MQRTRKIIVTAASLALMAGIGSSALAGGFTDGDMYLLTPAYPVLGNALVRIDPVTGDKTVIDEPTPSPNSFHRMSHDPFRDRLVIKEPGDALTLIDAQGGRSTLRIAWSATTGGEVFLWAPTGDGRIFLMTVGRRLGYVDSIGQTTDLLDVDGVTPLEYPFGATAREDLLYDAITNSLFLVHFGAATQVVKFPLTPDGSQLAGPPQVASYDAFPPTADEPMGFSAGPGGTLFIKIDTNSNAAGVRMFTVDPVTLQFADFANIGHMFVAGNTCGTYNSVHGYGAALDTGNDAGYIRTYVQSATEQEGALLTTGVSSEGGSGELGRLITIGDTVSGIGFCQGDVDGSGAVDVADLLNLLSAWGTTQPSASDSHLGPISV